MKRRIAVGAGVLAVVIVGTAASAFYLASRPELPAAAERAQLPAGGQVSGLRPAITPTPIPDQAAVVERLLASLSDGEIAFNPPRSANTGDKIRVTARISQESGMVELTTGMERASAPVERIPIQVGAFMGAELTGDAFDIKDLTNRTQVVQAKRPSEWAWEIKATKAGRQALRLHVWVRIVAPPLPEQQKDLPVLDRDVDVQVSPAYSVSHFWENNWQWVLGSGFSASVLAAAAASWKRTRQSIGAGRLPSRRIPGQRGRGAIRIGQSR